jgi:hypothetical protein
MASEVSVRRVAAVAAAVVAAVVVFVRRRLGRRPVLPGRGGQGPGPSGVREPRRPLVPAASGAAEVPLPE